MPRHFNGLGGSLEMDDCFLKFIHKKGARLSNKQNLRVGHCMYSLYINCFAALFFQSVNGTLDEKSLENTFRTDILHTLMIKEKIISTEDVHSLSFADLFELLSDKVLYPIVETSFNNHEQLETFLAFFRTISPPVLLTSFETFFKSELDPNETLWKEYQLSQLFKNE